MKAALWALNIADAIRSRKTKGKRLVNDSEAIFSKGDSVSGVFGGEKELNN